eukprot:SAG31_NODE_2699_length_5225_cov_2.190987_3_plen_129_part_00
MSYAVAQLCPPFLVVSLTLVYSMLGNATFAGMAVLIAGMVLNSALMKRLKRLRAQQMGQTDQRVMQTNEALLGIRVVKCNCWEDAVAKRISTHRAVELKRIRSMERLQALWSVQSLLTPRTLCPHLRC